MVPKMNSTHAAANIRRETSAGVRWYVRDHIVIPNKKIEIPYLKFNDNRENGMQIH